jgi:hypothetical protein
MIGDVDAPAAMGTLHAGVRRDTVEPLIGDAPASLEFE